jgi:hypothetical protein
MSDEVNPRPRGGDLVYEDFIQGDLTHKIWHDPGLPGLKFGHQPQPERVRDPRLIPGRDMKHRPDPLEPCHINHMLTADSFLPVAEEHLWRPGESLWYGTMKAKDLEVGTEKWTSLLKECINFFNHPRTVTWDYNKKCYVNHMPKNWRPIWGKPEITTAPDYPPDMSTELLCKALWLVTEYLDSGCTFSNAMCAHYNPRLRDNIIHPGGLRKKLLKMYNQDDDDIKMFYFNTGGFYHDRTMCDLERYDFRDLKADVFKGYRANGSLVADHGTLIPHIYVGSDVIYDRQYEFLDMIQDRIVRPDFNISFNEPWAYELFSRDFPFILPASEYGHAYCNVEMRGPRHPWAKVSQEWYREMIVMMAVVHALLNRPYRDNKVKIEFKS